MSRFSFVVILFFLPLVSVPLTAQPNSGGDESRRESRPFALKNLGEEQLDRLKRTEHGERLFMIRHLEVLRSKIKNLEWQMAEARAIAAWDQYSDLSADLQLMELAQRSLRASLVAERQESQSAALSTSDPRKNLLEERIFLLRNRMDDRSNEGFF